MPYSVTTSGADITITQTGGVETDLSGLVGLSGVTTRTEGNGTPDRDITVYTLDVNTNLVLDAGELTIDPTINRLEILKPGNNVIQQNASHTLNLGRTITSPSGVLQYSALFSIMHLAETIQPFQEFISFSGHLNWNGSAITTTGSVDFIGAASAVIRNAKLEGLFRTTNAPLAPSIYLASTGVIDIDGLDVFSKQAGDAGIVFTAPLDVSSQVKNVNPVGAFLFDGRFTTNRPIPIAVVDAVNITNGQTQAFTAFGKMLNIDYNGMSVRTDSGNFTGVGSNPLYTSAGELECAKTLKVRLLLDNIPQQNVKFYFKEIDNGNRQQSIAADWGVDYSITRESFVLSDVNGEATLEVREIAYYRPYEASPSSSSYTVTFANADLRINSDLTITTKSISYDTEISSIVFEGSTAESPFLTIRLSADSLKSAPEATVAAYINIETDTTLKFYDALKLYLVDNYSDEDNPIVRREGNLLLAGAYNVDVRSVNAVSDFDGSTVFGKATAYDGSIETTGTIVLDAISENKIVKDASLVTITTKPDVLTVDNAILELSPGDDVTGYIELNGGSYRATADGNYIARGKSAGIVDANGFNITVDTVISLQIQTSGYMSGSRVYIKNATTGQDWYNAKVVGNTLNLDYTETVEFTTGDIIEVYTCFTNSTNSYDGFGQSVASINGASVLVTEREYTDYATKGIDGSSQTDFVLDGTNLQLDIQAGSNQYSNYALSAWYRYQMYDSAVAIKAFFNALNTSDGATYIFDTSKGNLLIDNLSANLVFEITGSTLRRDDGLPPYLNPTTGGGHPEFKWRDDAIAVETGVSGLTATESNRLLNTALEATLTEIKGVGWATETLKDIRENAGSGGGASETKLNFLVNKSRKADKKLDRIISTQ